MRQRGWQSETRALTLGPRSVSSVQRKARLSFLHGTPPFASEPLDAKSRHGPSAGAVIRITGPQKISVALSGTVFLRASPVTPHIITSHGLSSASAPKTDKYRRSYQICRRDTGIRALPAGAGAHRLF